jgi:hypothetical protein
MDLAEEGLPCHEDRFIWDMGDVEVHLVTALAIAYDAAGNQLHEVEVVDANPTQAAHRVVDKLYRQPES